MHAIPLKSLFFPSNLRYYLLPSALICVCTCLTSTEAVGPFLQGLISRAQFAVYNEGLDAVLRVLGVERPTGEKDTGTLSEDKNGQDNGMAKSNLAGIACCSSFNYIKGSIFRANEYGAVLPP